MNKTNRIVAAVCFLAGLVLYHIVPYQVSLVSTSPVTLAASFFPRFIAILMMGASAALFLQAQVAIARGYEVDDSPASNPPRRGEAKAAAVFVMIVVYSILMDRIGFILSSLLFGFSLLAVLKAGKWWHYPIYAACVGVIYYVFRYLLYVHLPALGVWFL
ncbi:MAG: tripartite tricarboxylate transporter TctB family protein [Planctomycetota bacterium]|jgi:putative tricarboxylic transport membrane protein|nr:tripartite tricarboxylate transporter TctB family protein [Planctomycetota bacterium]